MVGFPHVVLFLFVAREDADFLDFRIEEAVDDRMTKRTGPAGDQEDLPFEDRGVLRRSFAQDLFDALELERVGGGFVVFVIPIGAKGDAHEIGGLLLGHVARFADFFQCHGFFSCFFVTIVWQTLAKSASFAYSTADVLPRMGDIDSQCARIA